jgi:hypothetical protein
MDADQLRVYRTVWHLWDRTISWDIKTLPYGNRKVLDKTVVRNDNPVFMAGRRNGDAHSS